MPPFVSGAMQKAQSSAWCREAGTRGATLAAPRLPAPRLQPYRAVRPGGLQARQALAIPTAQWGDDAVSVTALQAIMAALFGAGASSGTREAPAAPAASLFSSL
jgi:hypothetical protein